MFNKKQNLKSDLYFAPLLQHPSLFSSVKEWKCGGGSEKLCQRKTSQLLYHLEKFKWVQQPSSYDNSIWRRGWRGHFFEDSWSHCIPQRRERAMAKFNPHRLTLRRAAPSTRPQKYACRSLGGAATALLSSPLHPSAGQKKDTKAHGPTARGIEK